MFDKREVHSENSYRLPSLERLCQTADDSIKETSYLVLYFSVVDRSSVDKRKTYETCDFPEFNSNFLGDRRFDLNPRLNFPYTVCTYVSRCICSVVGIRSSSHRLVLGLDTYVYQVKTELC